MSRTVRIVHHKSPIGAVVIVAAAAGMLFTSWLQKPSAPIMPAQTAIAAPAPLSAEQITAAVKAALPAPAAPAAAPAAPTVKTVVKTVVKKVRVSAPAPRYFTAPHYHICSCSL